MTTIDNGDGTHTVRLSAEDCRGAREFRFVCGIPANVMRVVSIKDFQANKELEDSVSYRYCQKEDYTAKYYYTEQYFFIYTLKNGEADDTFFLTEFLLRTTDPNTSSVTIAAKFNQVTGCLYRKDEVEKTIRLIDPMTCQHEFGEWKTVRSATRQSEGQEKRTCIRCGAVETRVIPALVKLGDVDQNGVVDAADARQALRCAVNLDPLEKDSAGFRAADADFNGKVESGDARLILRETVGLEVFDNLSAEHPYHDWLETSVTEPSCVVDGKRVSTCQVCRAKKTEKILAPGHVPGAVEVTREATCTREGSGKTTCRVCGRTVYNTIPKLPHDFAPATCTTPKKCTVCGETEGSKLGHAEIVNGRCTRCGKAYTTDVAALQEALLYRFDVTMRISTVGYLNKYVTVEYRNSTGYDVGLPAIVWANGKGCYFKGAADYFLETGMQTSITYYRAVVPEDWFDAKYNDMYLDNQSVGDTYITICDQRFYVTFGVNGLISVKYVGS